MRRRLYQAIPEESEMNDISVSEAKIRKRLYAEDVVSEQGTKATAEAIRDSSFTEMDELTDRQLESFYAFWDCYENECSKITWATYDGWIYSTSTAAKILDYYMHMGETTWGMVFSFACQSASVPMKSLLHLDYKK